MAGLSAAWLLSREGFRVTIFEKGSNPGLAAHSRDFSSHALDVEGQLIGDVPSRMFNASLWPAVTELYQDAGVDFEPVDHQQTFLDAAKDVRLKIGLPYDTVTMLKSTFNPKTRKLLSDLRAFQKIGREAIQSDSANTITFDEFLKSSVPQRSSSDFLNEFLLPALTSTVFTCPPRDLLRYPCDVVLDALDKISNGGRRLMRTVHGSQDAAKRLLVGVDSFLCRANVERIAQRDETVLVYANGVGHEFDQLIVATQANHASKLVASEFPETAALLAKFRYVDVPVVVHTDSSTMPIDKGDWGTFNFQSSESGASSCTVWMNRFHDRWPEADNVFHTIFPCGEIDSAAVIASANLQRPVVDSNTKSLHSELELLHSQNRRIWFAGSYAASGVPLLESAVQSSHSVVKRIASKLAQSTK
jgi:predicted NAD/FAD-binding protein